MRIEAQKHAIILDIHEKCFCKILYFSRDFCVYTYNINGKLVQFIWIEFQ